MKWHGFKKIILAGLISTLLLNPALIAKASIVSSYKDTLSNQTAGAAANHTITFVAPSGVQVATDTINVTFASDFDLGALVVPDDVDIAFDDDAACDGPFTDKTLAVGPAPGVWGVATSGKSIIFTPPVGESIAANRCVAIEVGTNATFGVSGAHAIVNPPTVGTKYVSVSGGFGDSGLLAVPIVNPGQVAIGVTINTGNSGGGGGGGGEVRDTTAPTLQNIRVTNLQETSAEIRWETDELATSYVEYGKTAGFEIGSVGDNTRTFNHVVPLATLEPGTTYRYRVRSTDASGNTAVSAGYTFTTPMAADLTPPEISGIQITNITGTSAAVGWNTNEAADSKVEYGLTVTYGPEVTEATLVRAHLVQLTGLTSETEYHVRVSSRDAAGNRAVSEDRVFTTKDITPPVISNIQVSERTTTGAKITWRTNEPSITKLAFGQTENYGQIHEELTLKTNHEAVLTGLHDATQYFAKITARDAAENESASDGFAFMTLADTTAPANVSNALATPGDRRIDLSWRNPEDADFLGVRIVRRTDRYPANPTDGVIIFEGNATSRGDTGLTNGQTYWYGIFAYDTRVNFASGAYVNGTPIAPVRCGDAICSESETAATCPADCRALPQEVCGNGQCANGETVQSCPADCTPIVLPQGPVCGDNKCEAGETNATCPADCPAIVNPGDQHGGGTVCGNNQCEAGETVENCRVDCGAQEKPPVIPADLDRLSIKDIVFRALGGAVTIVADENRIFHLPAGITGEFVVNDTPLQAGTVLVTLQAGRDTYRMEPVSSYVATVRLPDVLGEVPGEVKATYGDGNFDREAFTISLEDRGRILEAVGENYEAISGARVELQELRNGVWKAWNGSTWSQENPRTSDANGAYLFLVEKGTYRVFASAQGFFEKTSSAVTRAGIINSTLILERVPPPPITKIGKVISDDRPIAQKVTEVAKVVSTEVAAQTKVIVEEVQRIADDPAVEEQVEAVVAPTVTAVAVTNTAIATSATVFNMSAYIQYLITQPLLWFGRRKRKGWGTVYNSLTKLPVDLVMVRLLDAVSGRVLQSRVTDRQGKYFFIIGTGTYKLQIVKPGFVFPSVYMKDAKTDLEFADLYHGEVIQVKEEGATIAANIPIDPVGKPLVSPLMIRVKEWLRGAQRVIAGAGIVASFIAVYITPTALTIAMAVAQVVLFVLFMAIAEGKKPKSWGIVYDKETNRPIANTVVRIFEPKYNKLLDTFITDKLGRYAFVVGPNTYYTTYERAGYHPTKVMPIDFSKQKESSIVRYKVPLSSSTQPMQKKTET